MKDKPMSKRKAFVPVYDDSPLRRIVRVVITKRPKTSDVEQGSNMPVKCVIGETITAS